MNHNFTQTILQATAGTALHKVEEIQSLWSGYGSIVRYQVDDYPPKTVIVKHIRPPDSTHHPRGWNTDRSHQRKLKSYQVEAAWYSHFSRLCDDITCRVPHCLALESTDTESLILLEDLDAAGFPIRLTRPSQKSIYACITWLANFHATFLGKKPDGLWTQGTYWHLETRPDELEELNDIPLKSAAAEIDSILSSSPYQTLVHGDAKLANFCFSQDGNTVAAVDFQYVGGGCGMKDLAYFIGSCLDETQCEKQETSLLDHYFKTIRKTLQDLQSPVDHKDLEDNWRQLYPIAWTDFHRFLKGWSPGHWKLNSYSERLTQSVISQLTS